MEELEAFEALVGQANGEVVVRGDFDMGSERVFDEALQHALVSEPATLTIDLSGVTFLASSGLACLVRANRSHPHVVLRGCRPAHLRVLEITGLCTAFRFEDPAPS
jgi:anti-anti-sigma factor